MQMPSTPWSIMQSNTRRWLSRSRSPLSRNGVGAIGTTPPIGLALDGMVGPPDVSALPHHGGRMYFRSSRLGSCCQGNQVPGRRRQPEIDRTPFACHAVERRRLDALGCRLAVGRAQVVVAELQGLGDGQVLKATRLDANRHRPRQVAVEGKQAE